MQHFSEYVLQNTHPIDSEQIVGKKYFIQILLESLDQHFLTLFSPRNNVGYFTYLAVSTTENQLCFLENSKS